MNDSNLIRKYLIGDITAEEVKQLEESLAASPALRKEFAIAAATETGLRDIAFERAAEPVANKTAFAQGSRFELKRMLSLIVAVAGAITLMIAAYDWICPKTVATLVTSEDAAWESLLPTTPGSDLSPGILDLKSGVATIRFESGANVILEAPAQLELLTPMRARLLSGAVVVDVPEPAIGFVMETPNGYVVDYGTQFAVRVDKGRQESMFEIIEGEIAVHHPTTGNEVRLSEPGKTATISDRMLVAGAQDSAVELVSSVDVIRLGTNGRCGSALRANRRKRIDPETLSVKRSNSGKWDHRSFFSFDLSSVDIDAIATARLRLNLVPSSRGTASRLPKINRFGIYGIANPTMQDWEIECQWEDSPDPDEGVLLGTFEIARSQKRGIFGIQNDELLNFVKSNQGATVTFVLARETTEIKGVGPGLMHLFASDQHPETVGPMLEFSMP